MFVIYCIILILFIYFIYLIVKYSGTEKPEYELQYFRDQEYVKYPPIIVGYLNNKTVKEEHFVATVLDFVTKGSINIEKTLNDMDYIFTITNKIEATNIEIKTLEVFFNSNLEIGTKQTFKHFKQIMSNEKKFGNYGKLKRSFNTAIRDYLDKKEDIKQITKKTNIKNILLCYILFVIALFTSKIITENFRNINIIYTLIGNTITFGLFIIALHIIKLSLLGTFSLTVFAISISLLVQTLLFALAILNTENFLIIFLLCLLMAIVILFDDMLQRRKTNLANTYEMVKGLKMYIKDYSNINEYDIYHIHLWEKYYVYAVALNIKKI